MPGTGWSSVEDAKSSPMIHASALSATPIAFIPGYSARTRLMASANII
ncbi:hypothetical protein BIFADO_01131 [Bifidobacterium adolescentis L2-32]|uniref:Uncharacterized protein n=1 Tax=Bifidobacterium adolescentis L2-32 TaxID=411481 RepID=A7A5L1_BIFAD|nr:hypothetical protein BIFADO_01131 [Bifidobacterium adolescentis L2-32]